MKKKLLSKKLLLLFLVLFLNIATDIHAQDYSWTGASDSNFYNVANWASTGSILFDNGGFRVARTNAVGSSPVINQFIDWQPGIFDNTAGNLTVNADFNVFFDDKLNGLINVNTGATFTCRNIFRLGREGIGTLNVNGGTFRSSNVGTWQGIFIGALAGGNGTANINNGGIIDGGYNLEIGTRDFYPTGVLNVNNGGTAGAYWNTWIGPNGTINMNGGTLNTGETFIVGDLLLDNTGNSGTIGSTVGILNINSGIVNVNQNDSAGINFSLHTNAKVIINTGSLVIKRTGVDYTSIINTFVTGGQIAAVAGKSIVVTYDGVLTTVTAKTVLSVNDFKVAENTFTIYPNPVQDVINIVSKNSFSGDLKVVIVDLLGKTIVNSQTVKSNSGLYSIDVKNKLASGMYLVQINNGSSNFSSKIMVK